MSYPVAFPLEAGSGPLVGDLDVVLEQLLALLSHERQGNAADQMIPRAVEIIENRALVVQSILSLVQADATSRLAALLHMLPELAGELTAVQFVKRFGPEVAQIKENLQKLAKMTFATRVLNQPHGKGRELPSIELLRRMLLVIAADVRVVIVHLAIRLDLLRQFSKAEVPSDEAVLVETRDVLVPLANRLGLSHLKWELEDLCFRLLEPQKYKLLAQALAQKRTDRESFVESAVEALKAALSKKSLQVQVYGRPKHLSSIAQKIEQKHLILAQIHDLHALRVIVQTIEQCYVALDVVRSLWRAKDEEFDDYVARPKTNGYQSIHCVVDAGDGLSLEVQIRTQEMHRFAEYGVASHWRYKELGGTPPARGSSAASRVSHEAQLSWMRQLLAWQQELAGGLNLNRGRQVSSKDNLAFSGTDNEVLAAPGKPSNTQNRIYALTPQAKVIELPAGATPLDFAYHLHSGLGHRCRGAKVNAMMVPLTTQLKNADVCEIVLASKNQFDAGPSLDWLGAHPIYLVSARAKSKVRQWFLAHQPHAPEVSSELPPEVTTHVKERQVVDRLAMEVGAPARGSLSDSSHTTEGILVVGVDALMTRLARCCRPIPPDPITGYVSLGKGVTVHRSACSSLSRLAQSKAERLIPTSWGSWENYQAERRFPADLEIIARERTDLLRDISEALAKGHWHVRAVRMRSHKDQSSIQCTVEIASQVRLRDAITALTQVPGVESVRRIADFGRKA